MSLQKYGITSLPSMESDRSDRSDSIEDEEDFEEICSPMESQLNGSVYDETEDSLRPHLGAADVLEDDLALECAEKEHKLGEAGVGNGASRVGRYHSHLTGTGTDPEKVPRKGTAEDDFEPEKIKEFYANIQSGDIEKTRAMVSKEPGIINVAGTGVHSGTSPVHLAASGGFDVIAALFLRQGFPLCRVTLNAVGRDPMHEAAIAGSLAVMTALSDGNGFKPDVQDCFGFTALHYAAMLEHQSSDEMIQFLVRTCYFETEAEVAEPTGNVTSNNAGRMLGEHDECIANRRTLVCEGDTALHIAAKFSNYRGCKRLLELGASACAVNARRKTPLHCVVALPQSDTVYDILKLLLVTGSAPVNAVDQRGHTVLHVAAEANAVHMMAYLCLNTKANKRERDFEGRTPLHVAAAAGNVECVELLQSWQPDALDDLDFQGNSVLHLAVASKNDTALVKLLLDFEGINAELTNFPGKTAKALALEMGKAEVAKQLQSYIDLQQKRAEERGFGSMVLKTMDAHSPKSLYGAKKTMDFPSPKNKVDTPKNTVMSQTSKPLPPPQHISYGYLPPIVSTSMAMIAEDTGIHDFVNKFTVFSTDEKMGSSTGMDEVYPSIDAVTIIKDFMNRFASRTNFDRFIGWTRKGHGLDPPPHKVTMGYQDMITLLDAQGLMDELVSRSEIYKIFWTKTTGQYKATSKEITYSVFCSHMHKLASQAPKALLEKFLSQPDTLEATDNFTPCSSPDSSDEDLEASSKGMTVYKRNLIDPNDYVPTVTGINCPSGHLRGLSSSSRLNSRTTSPSSISRAISRGSACQGARPSSEMRPSTESSELSMKFTGNRLRRSQSPDSLMEAFRDFSPSASDKIRVDQDSGPSQQAAWASGMSFSKNKLHDLKESERSLLSRSNMRRSGSQDSMGPKYLQSPSRFSTGTMQRSKSSLAQRSSTSSFDRVARSASSLVWKPEGCSRSRVVLEILATRAAEYKPISDLTHCSKPIWIEFSPTVAPTPQLIDGAHEATYSMCFEKGDYVGCFEVIQSSLKHTSPNEVELYQRTFSQAVIFCNSFAERCIKARNIPAAAVLLHKAEKMTGPDVKEYPGRKALLGWTMDTLAHYYYSRKKWHAALQYMNRALDRIEVINSAEGKATWHAHMAAILFACGRAPEAVEFIKKALSEIVGGVGSITREHILQGKIPHVHRFLASALCFNLGVCQVELNQMNHGLTSCQFALLLCHDGGDRGYLKRMERFHDTLVSILEVRAGIPTLGKTVQASHQVTVTSTVCSQPSLSS